MSGEAIDPADAVLAEAEFVVATHDLVMLRAEVASTLERVLTLTRRVAAAHDEGRPVDPFDAAKLVTAWRALAALGKALDT